MPQCGSGVPAPRAQVVVSRSRPVWWRGSCLHQHDGDVALKAARRQPHAIRERCGLRHGALHREEDPIDARS